MAINKKNKYANLEPEERTARIIADWKREDTLLRNERRVEEQKRLQRFNIVKRKKKSRKTGSLNKQRLY